MDYEYSNVLSQLDQTHFWFRAKQYYLRSVITKEEANILDVGCGPGGNIADFDKKKYNIIGIDKCKTAISYYQEKGRKGIQWDLENTQSISIGLTLDYIVALDIIEHLQNPTGVLKNLRGLSCPKTKLIITVPAYQCLWSEWDVCMGHIKRYSPKLLIKELSASGWIVDELFYIHHFLVLPALLQRKVYYGISRYFLNKKQKRTFYNPVGLINKILSILYYFEYFLHKIHLNPPFGLSIFVVARPVSY